MHLVHWGLMTAERTCSLEERLEHYGCPYDKVLQHAPEQHAALYPRPALPCFVPTKDTVIPSSVSDHLHPELLQPEVGTLLCSPPAALLRSCMLWNGTKSPWLQRSGLPDLLRSCTASNITITQRSALQAENRTITLFFAGGIMVSGAEQRLPVVLYYHSATSHRSSAAGP